MNTAQHAYLGTNNELHRNDSVPRSDQLPRGLKLKSTKSPSPTTPRPTKLKSGKSTHLPKTSKPTLTFRPTEAKSLKVDESFIKVRYFSCESCVSSQDDHLPHTSRHYYLWGLHICMQMNYCRLQSKQGRRQMELK